VKNTGTIPVPVRIRSWLERSTSGWVSAAEEFTLEPGETRVAKLENMAVDNAKDIRFSLYYGANDPKVPVGGKLTLLDGITLVQSPTAPDFPFNGDGIMPVETLKRRNLFLDPALTTASGWSTADSIEAVTFRTGWTENQLPQGLRQKQVDGTVHAESPVVSSVAGGDVVTLGMGFSTNIGCGVSLRIYWYDDSGYVGNESMQVGGRGLGKFDRVSVAGTAPAGANKFRASVWMTGSVDADSILYME